MFLVAVWRVCFRFGLRSEAVAPADEQACPSSSSALITAAAVLKSLGGPGASEQVGRSGSRQTTIGLITVDGLDSVSALWFGRSRTFQWQFETETECLTKCRPMRRTGTPARPAGHPVADPISSFRCFLKFGGGRCCLHRVEIIETKRHRNPDREELKLFLAACRDAAQDDDHFKIASITLETRSLDPLAVLESIYERGVHHFYLEHPSEGWALAGAEPVVLETCSGADRAAKMKAWSEEILEHTVAVGDLDASMGGPHFYAALTFEAEFNPTGAFSPATVFLPRWQVARRSGATTAVANFRVDPDSDLDRLTARLWAAYEKFNTFSSDAAPCPPPATLQSQMEVGPVDGFIHRVGRALHRIEEGRCEKVVIARAVDYVFDRPFRPLVTLAGLRERYRSCYVFSFENDAGQSFIGASPERLVAVQEGRLKTEALAGTAPRGNSATEDAWLGQALLQSEKDRREHAHVVASIRRRLSRLGIELDRVGEPSLRVLRNVQHLQTPLTAPLPEGVHLLDLIAALHPTPAVGGVPREVALPIISELEPFSRDLYAGALGFFDHRGEGEFLVGLRSALVDGVRARLFAGAGIVAGSDPAAEWRETEMKFAALREAISAQSDGD